MEGNVGLQVFASVTQSPRGQNYDSNSADSDMITLFTVLSLQPVRTWFSRYQRSIYHAEKLQQFQLQDPSSIMLVRNARDVELLLNSRTSSGKPVGALLAVEGAQNLEGRIENVDGLFESGYRMLGLTHFFDNRLAGSMHGIEKGGLTDFGRQVLSRAEKLGMVIDLAHSSPATMDEVLDLATRPVVVSHGGVRATCDVNRNLNDGQIRRIAAGGGLIGIGYWDAAVCDTSPQGIVAAMDHVRKLVGVEHIALGSDFDGAVSTEFDTTGLVLLTQALQENGYRDADIRLVMGGNAVRFLRENLPQ
jgi:microsomal dipeptidase-like Zn-dependent dipeptidase